MSTQHKKYPRGTIKRLAERLGENATTVNYRIKTKHIETMEALRDLLAEDNARRNVAINDIEKFTEKAG